MKKSGFILFFCLMLVVVMLASVIACAKPEPGQPATAPAAAPKATPATGQPQYGGVLKNINARLPASPFGLPAKIRGDEIQFIIPAVEALVWEDSKIQLQPMLATAWKVAPDKSSITFTLRQGVKFHDGTDFNASAAKWNMDQIKDAKMPGTSYWTSIDVVDNYTVRVNMSKWENTQLASFAGRNGLMVSPTAVQKNGVDWAGANPVGTGPFKFVKFERDVSLEYSKFDNYWQKGKPYLDGVKYLCIPDQVTQITAFKVGDGDVISAWDAKVLSDLRTVPGTSFSYAHDGVIVLYPDDGNADSPFSNLKVRQALEYAIDKEAIMVASGYGIFEAAYQAARPGSIGYISNLPYRKYDPAKAKQLLTEAGYPNGFKTRIITGAAGPSQLAAQDQLAKVGIQAELEVGGTAAQYAKYRTEGWHNAVILNPMAANPNFIGTVTFYYMTPGDYVSLKGPAGLKDMYNEALLTAEVEPAKVEKVARALFDYSALIPLNYMGTGRVFYNKVHDAGFLTFSGFTGWSPENTWLSK